MKNVYKYLRLVAVLFVFFSVPLKAQTLSEPEANKESIAIELYPNPSQGEFRVEISLPDRGSFTARLYDMTGKMVEDLSDQIREESKKYSGNVRLENLSGIYFLKIESQGKSATKKVIIR